jgi:choline dehydrogenase-like flavoprotein
LRLPTIAAHGRRVAAAFDRLGWHWWPVDLVVGRDADAPGTAHCDHIGPCDLGCPSRLRSSADRAFMRDALGLGARLVPRTRVLTLEHDCSGRVTAAVCAGAAGEFRVRGERFVLAANGLGTPRLLLLSASGRCPDGLANSSGLVGRNLMLHPYARVDGVFDEPLGSWVRGEKAGFVSFEFYPTKRERGFVRGFKLQLVTAPGPAALACGAVVGERLPWGEGHHRRFEERFDRICGLTVCGEDLPDPENRITLSSRLRGRDGLPAPKMIYKVSNNSRRMLDFGLDRGEEVLREAGARAVHRTPLRDQSGFHIMGTARMGLDPDRSVTDPFGRCHDAPNLFVVDASVFVTASAANPTATAQAIALRAADHIAATRRA